MRILVAALVFLSFVLIYAGLSLWDERKKKQMLDAMDRLNDWKD